MRILIDATTSRTGGGITYIRHLIPALLAQDSGHEYHILLSKRYQDELIKTLPVGVHPVLQDLPANPLIRRWLFLQTSIPRMLREDKFDLIFTVAEISTVRAPCPSVTLVRNANYLFSSPSSGPIAGRARLFAQRIIRRPLVKLSLNRSDKLVFVSETFRSDVVNQTGLNIKKTAVIHHGVAEVFRLPDVPVNNEVFLDNKPYLFTVSSISQHKNLEVMYYALAEVIKKTDSNIQLVIAGGISEMPIQRRLLALGKKLDIADRTHLLGAVPYHRLSSLYKNALASIFPSALESFGHPLVEAMACGKPVIASDVPVCHELCRDAAIYFPPNSPSELAESILNIMRDPSLREKMSDASLKRSSDFSWEQNAAQLVNVFEEAVRQANPILN